MLTKNKTTLLTATRPTMKVVPNNTRLNLREPRKVTRVIIPAKGYIKPPKHDFL